MKILVFSVAIVCALALSQVTGVQLPPNELRYSDKNAGDNNQIPPTPSDRPDNEDKDDDRSWERPSPPVGPGFHSLFPSFFHSGFDNGPFAGPQNDLESPQPFGGIFTDIYGRMKQQAENFEKTFEKMRELAEQGEEVIRFEKDGVVYQRTCTTKRLDPADRNQQLIPSGQQQPRFQETQQQQSQQPQQPESSRDPAQN